jgi:uncharacterized protein HemX
MDLEPSNQSTADSGDQDSSQSSVDEEEHIASKSGTSDKEESAGEMAEGRVEPLAQQETIAVNRSKLLVYMALLLAAALGTVAYVYTSREEKKTFESEVRRVRICSCRILVELQQQATYIPSLAHTVRRLR